MSNYKTSYHVLQSGDALKLNGLVGQDLLFVGGSNLDANSLAESLVFCTAGRSVKVAFTLAIDNFEGFEEDYPSLSISEVRNSELGAIQNKGTLNLTFQGSTINEIQIVREVTTFEHMGVLSWKLVADVGVVLRLGSRAISFLNLTDFDVVGALSFHSNFDVSQLDTSDTLNESNLIDHYSVVRQLVDLQDFATGL